MRDQNPALPRHWAFHPPSPDSATAPLREELQLHPLMADLLWRRDITTVEAARRFLRPSLEQLHDPFLLLGMQAAAERIADGLERDEKIVVSGDYDVDGITSSTVLAHFLTGAGARALQIFIPNRFDHGYGLTARSVEALRKLAPKLVITVDNGIAARKEVLDLHAAGIDTVITDHHLPPPEGVPPGIVVNPRQPGCGYPFKAISGCGVALKLITALRKTLRDRGWWSEARPEPNLKQYLDLVAIGTVADVVPLVDENRVFVRAGLEVMARGPNRPGLIALMAVSRVKQPLTARKIAFQIAPRINAAGRMDEGSLAVELLLAEDGQRAEQLAQRLDEQNRKRRAREEEMLREALDIVKAQGADDPAALVVASPGFHEGIVGIIASRLVDRFHCPTVVLAQNGDGYKGSARSVPNVNVAEALGACGDLLQQSGGHAGAAGCRLAKENLVPFREAFARACRGRGGQSGDPITHLDGRLSDQAPERRLVEQIGWLEPFGHGNEEPSFLVEGAGLPSDPQVLAEKHLKWRLPDGAEMIAWNGAGRLPPPAGLQFRVKLGFNEYRGARTIQMVVEEFAE